MALGKHMEEEEALAVLKLSSYPEWPLLKNYLSRRYALEAKECMGQKEPYVIYRAQGAAVILEDIGKIEQKAKHLLEGE
jgi:hypothetical protein